MIKKPVDFKIIVWLFFISAILAFFGGLSMIFGTSELPNDFGTRTFLIFFSMGTKLELAILDFGVACLSLISAICVLNRSKFGWWFVLISTLINICDSVIDFTKSPAVFAIAIFMGIGFIIWLVWRREFFKSRKEQKLSFDSK
jgi:hypothetical protein